MMTSDHNISRLDTNGPKADPSSRPLPILDLHCDLLTYLASVKGPDPASEHEIGCSLPYLRSGNVKLQVMAIYSGGGTSPTGLTDSQIRWFRKLATDSASGFFRVTGTRLARKALRSSRTGIVVALENASALCDDDESMDVAFQRLDRLVEQTGPLLYISLTHHGENRFGGGNSASAGLRSDGRVLLDYIADKRISIDLSHASDALAHGIVNHIDRHGLDIPIIASHSNFRSVYDHRRNLPDDLVQVIIERKGLIGMNFLRAFLHPDDASSLVKHILFGIEMGARDALCFGADFAYVKDHPDKSRVPFYFKDHEHAGKYGQIVRSLEHILSPDQVAALAYGNGMRFLQRLWSTASSVTGSEGVEGDNEQM